DVCSSDLTLTTIASWSGYPLLAMSARLSLPLRWACPSWVCLRACDVFRPDSGTPAVASRAGVVDHGRTGSRALAGPQPPGQRGQRAHCRAAQHQPARRVLDNLRDRHLAPPAPALQDPLVSRRRTALRLRPAGSAGPLGRNQHRRPYDTAYVAAGPHRALLGHQPTAGTGRRWQRPPAGMGLEADAAAHPSPHAGGLSAGRGDLVLAHPIFL